ncbi:hypothetical protein [uncultured Arcticibacterium sp.]|uniref:hypothetical protein n=1 Tax=uncultured Arcticibacterium sp. TaxID=2173042 RepID=UPI0030F80641
MKNKIKGVLILAILSSTSLVHAQIFSAERLLKRAKDRVNNRTEQKVNDKVDGGVDKVLDGIFKKVDEPISKKEKPDEPGKTPETQTADLLGGLFGSLGTAPNPLPTYSFQTSYVMEVKVKDKKEVTEMVTKYFFDKNGENVGSKVLSMSSGKKLDKEAQAIDFMVMDTKNNGMYSFMNMNGKKSMIGVSLGKETQEDIQNLVNEGDQQGSFVRTNETLTIAGRNTYAYVMTDENGTVSKTWISDKPVPEVAAYYKTFQKMMQNDKASKANTYGGNAEMNKLVMEGRAVLGMDSKDKKGAETQLRITEINANDNFTFNTAGYDNMMDIGKIMSDAQNQNN